MPTRVLRSADDIPKLASFLGARTKWPVTVTITQGAGRRDAQNRLSQKWNADISRQLEDQTFEEVRAYNKLHFGVSIMRAENEAFRQKYDRILKHLPYEEKLHAIEVFDLPVTRLMTVKQMSAYMDAVQRHWLRQGVMLTDPDSLKYEEEFS